MRGGGAVDKSYGLINAQPLSPECPHHVVLHPPYRAVGCAKLGQLLVWEWRSDSYVLKQQGHYFDISAVAFSPDGALVATGSDDRKV